MEEYDHDLGFHTTEMERMSFKIDHHIPLCMGGSNEQNNLWPQHSSVYQLTDPLEPLLCNIMSAGKIQQAEAVRIIHEVKQDPNTTDARIQELNATYHM